MKVLRLDETETISTGDEVIHGGVVGEDIMIDDGKLSGIPAVSRTRIGYFDPTKANNAGKPHSVVCCHLSVWLWIRCNDNEKYRRHRILQETIEMKKELP